MFAYTKPELLELVAMNIRLLQSQTLATRWRLAKLYYLRNNLPQV